MRTINRLKGKNGKRGIEQFIAVLILIVVAVVLGGLVYAYSSHLIGANQVNTGLQITGVTLSAPAGGTTAYLQISVQNTGSLAINGFTVYINGNGYSASSSVAMTLTPGQSYSGVITLNPITSSSGSTASITAGNEYAVYVIASASNGASVSTPIQNVIAQG